MALFAISFTGAGSAAKQLSLSMLAWKRLAPNPGTATITTFEMRGLFCTMPYQLFRHCS